MRICPPVQLGLGDRDRLEALIANGNTPQKHVRRARIVALAGDGIGTDQRRLGVSKPTIRRCMSRPAWTACAATRRARRARCAEPKTVTETPLDATHWSQRTMAKAVGIAPSSVQAIPEAAPGDDANDPRFAEKIEDVVGLYLNPPEHAIVLGRREVPDPSARPHPAGPAHEEGSGRNHDPRLQAPRHHHLVRGARCARRSGDRPMHAQAQASGADHPLPPASTGRSRRTSMSTWRDDITTTTRRVGAPQGQGVAGPSSASHMHHPDALVRAESM